MYFTYIVWTARICNVATALGITHPRRIDAVGIIVCNTFTLTRVKPLGNTLGDSQTDTVVYRRDIEIPKVSAIEGLKIIEITAYWFRIFNAGIGLKVRTQGKHSTVHGITQINQIYIAGIRSSSIITVGW